MFRRPGKNPLEEYKEEMTSYQYANDQETPSRLFDTPPRAQPMGSTVPDETQPEKWSKEGGNLPHHLQGMVQEEDPETTLGEGVSFRGELSFERLLRIDGNFEGDLLSQGKVVVGPKGKVTANLSLREAVIEGEVIGNVTVQEKLELRGHASVKGDIKAKRLVVDDGVEIIGVVQVSHSEKEATY